MKPEDVTLSMRFRISDPRSSCHGLMGVVVGPPFGHEPASEVVLQNGLRSRIAIRSIEPLNDLDAYDRPFLPFDALKREDDSIGMVVRLHPMQPASVDMFFETTGDERCSDLHKLREWRHKARLDGWIATGLPAWTPESARVKQVPCGVLPTWAPKVFGTLAEASGMEVTAETAHKATVLIKEEMIKLRLERDEARGTAEKLLARLRHDTGLMIELQIEE